MSTFNGMKNKKSNSKKRLGRGLGSLLPTESFRLNNSFDDPQDIPSFVEEKIPAGVTSNTSPMTFSEGQNMVNPSKPSRKVLSNYKKLSDNNSLNDSWKIFNLAIEKLIPNQTQPRKEFFREALQELSLSIKEQGILQPITVREQGDQFEIIAGERRWRASQMAGLKKVPVIIKDNVDDQKSMELALIENLQREDLNILEEAMGYQLLLDDYQLSQKELALKLGKKRSSIANALRILVLPEDVKEMLRQGSISLGHAKVLLSISDGERQSQLARKTIGKRLSVRALEREIRKEKSKDNESVQNRETSSEWVHELASSLQKILGTKVNVQYKKGKSQVNIAFYSDDGLSQFCEKIKNHWLKL